MSKVIKCKLDVNSLQKAIDELKAYRESIESKLSAFVDALMADGLKEASQRLASTVGDSTNASVGKSYLVTYQDRVVANIYLVGTDALFIEFGAGIAYNTGMQHPDAAEFGYGVGTYPSKHPPNRAMNPGWWIYRKDGVPIRSVGTGASMPIYYASETMRNNAVQKAMEVFRS